MRTTTGAPRLVTAIVVLAIVAMVLPVAADANCSAANGMSVAVITTKSGNATFNASTNAISTSTQQVAGAPYCYISDTLDIYKEIAGTYTWQNGKFYSVSKSDTWFSGVNAGPKYAWNFTGLSNGSWKFRAHSYRISNHAAGPLAHHNRSVDYLEYGQL